MKHKNDYSDNLHKEAKASTFQNARDLRNSTTSPEDKLWQLLRRRQINGWKFRRQHPIDKYVLDFYCHEIKLAIEIDGAFHGDKMNRVYDAGRTELLNGFGIHVMRFWNSDIENNIEEVIKRIREFDK